MCFKIDDSNKKGARRRYAWKVMKLTSQGYMQSLVYPSRSDKDLWNIPGAVIHRSSGPTRELNYICLSVDGYKSANGIYVYTSEVRAKLAAFACPNQVILKVKVSPKDLIHQGQSWKAVATYEKVTVAEDQPWIDWK